MRDATRSNMRQYVRRRVRHELRELVIIHGHMVLQELASTASTDNVVEQACAVARASGHAAAMTVTSLFARAFDWLTEVSDA